MRIAFLSQSFYPEIGGVSAVIMNLGAYLTERGHEVFAIHLAHSPRRVKMPSTYPLKPYPLSLEGLQSTQEGYSAFKEAVYLELHGLRSTDERIISQIPGYSAYLNFGKEVGKRASRAIDEIRPDLIHIQDYQLLSSLDYLPRLPSMVSLHAPYLPAPPNVVRRWLLDNLKRQHNIVVSLPQYAKALSKDGVPKHLLKAIPPTVDARPTRVARTRIRGSFRDLTKPDRCVITCIQRPDAKSGHDQLLRAFREAHRREPRLHLILVGAESFTSRISPERDIYLRRLARDLADPEFNECVTSLGNIDYVDLPLVYEISDVVCMLSRMECFGLAVTEAMMRGIPTLVTDVGGLAAQVVEGVTGFKVAVGDVPSTTKRMLDLARNHDAYNEMRGSSPSAFLEKFSPIVTVKEHEMIYGDLVREV